MSSEGVLFADSLSKPVAVRFDTEAMTSDGGAVLLGALDRGLGLTREVLPALQDERDPSRVTHCQLAMLRQRVYGLALGYEELKQLEVDRTSCHRFCANAFRVLLATLAYVLVQELRWRLRRTSLRCAQASTLRERLFKMAARVEESVRRFVLHCPVDFPWAREWHHAALAVGAVPG